LQFGRALHPISPGFRGTGRRAGARRDADVNKSRAIGASSRKFREIGNADETGPELRSSCDAACTRSLGRRRVRYVDYETDRRGRKITVCTAGKLYPLVSRIEARQQISACTHDVRNCTRCRATLQIRICMCVCVCLSISVGEHADSRLRVISVVGYAPTII